MDDEDLVSTALGLLLTQVRSARHALEEVERNTSRYLGFEFARALSEGPAFASPPMFMGALKVHIININDLAPGNGFGGFLQGLLGGIGNFIGGVVGGAVSGTLSVFALPQMIASMERITANISRILQRLGVNRPAAVADQENAGDNDGSGNADSNAEAQAQSGETLLTTVDGIGQMVRNLTALFQAGSTGSSHSGANQAGRTSPQVLTQSGERWMAILHGVNRLLDRMQHVVDGLIILIPILVGSLALLISNLSGIRRAILETIQFVLRNILVLRGVILTTIFETVATAARLVASIVTILGTTIQSVMTSIFGVISTILEAAFDALETLTMALQSVIRSLLQWLVNGVFNTLRAIGSLSIFRTVDHFIRILPGILAPIYQIVVAYKGGTGQLNSEITDRLNQAFDAGFDTTNNSTNGVPTTEQIIGDFPPLNEILDPLDATLSAAVDATAAHLTIATQETFDMVGSQLGQLAGTFDEAINAEAAFSNNILNTHFGRLSERAERLASAITTPIEAQNQPTGFEAIAAAYEGWLTNGNGLQQILNLATDHFDNRSASGEPGGGLSLLRGELVRPRASVEIDRVEIVIEEPTENSAESEISNGVVGSLQPSLNDEEIWLAWHRHNTDQEERNVRPADVRVMTG